MKRFLFFLITVIFTGSCVLELEGDVAEPVQGLYSDLTAGFAEKTRTYVEDDSSLRWHADDRLAVFYGNTLNQQYKFNGQTGDNSGTFSHVPDGALGTGNGLDYICAVYPYEAGVRIDDITGDVCLTLPSVQNYEFNSFGRGANTMIAVTKNTSDTFLSFKNLGGYLKLQVYAKEPGIRVSNIVIRGNNGEKLAGQSTAEVSYGSEPVIRMSEDATEEITLDCGDGVELSTDKDSPTSFWIVLPATTFTSGFMIVITDTSGRVFTKTTDKSVSIKRNTIQPMAPIEFIGEEVAPAPPDNQIWYTTTDGKILKPYISDQVNVSFGANIISNTYSDGKGVITFDGPITAIADWMFCSIYADAERLVSINIPSSVTEIGSDVFYRCSNLTEVVFHEGLKKLRPSFQYCTSLTEITLPYSVEDLSMLLFKDCTGLKRFKGKFATDGGRCLVQDGILWAYAQGSGSEYTIPDQVKVIGRHAFSGCDNLTSITINENVVAIEEDAFSFSDGLTEITIPGSVTTLKYMSFAYCSKLESVTLPETMTSMEKSVFEKCGNLKTVYCKAFDPPQAIAGLNDWRAFDATSKNLVIYVPSQSTRDYNYATGWRLLSDRIKGYDFYDTDDDPDIPNEIWYTTTDGQLITAHKTSGYGANIISHTYEDGKGVITFDNDVTIIPWGAFSQCKTITGMVLPESVELIDGLAFRNLENLVSIRIPDKTSVIRKEAFMFCRGLEDVTFSRNLKRIDKNAFYECKSLKRVALPEGLVSIGDYAFQNCESLTDVTVSGGTLAIGKYAFYCCKSLENLALQEGLTTIGECAFADCDNLKSISIPNSVKTIEGSLFSSSEGLEDVRLGSGLTAVPSAMFNGCSSLKGISLPNSITSIGTNAFLDCISLERVRISDNISTIESTAFQNCKALRSFTGKSASQDGRFLSLGNRLIAFAPSGITKCAVPDNISIIGKSLFSGCAGLKEVVISNSVTTIEDYAFAFCSDLESITIPKNVMTIGSLVFRNCTGLKSVYCKPEVPPMLGSDVFYSLPSDCRIYVPAASVASYKGEQGWSSYADFIEGYEFVDDDPVVMPTPNNNQIFYISSNSSVVTPYDQSAFNVSITSNVYSPDRNLGIITFSKDVTKVGENAFKDCVALTAVILPESIKTVGNNAFSGTKLTEFKLPPQAYQIGDYAFDGCTELKDVDFGTVKIIGSYAFRNCALTSVTLPECAESFGVRPFDCPSLMEFNGPHLKGDKRTLHVGLALVQLAEGACKGLKSFTIDEDVVNVCESVFQGYTKLEKVDIPEGVQYIARNAFNGCSGIKKLILPSTLAMLGNYAFKDCASLLSVYFNAPQPPRPIYLPEEKWEPCDRGTVVRVLMDNVDNYRNDGYWWDYIIEGFNEGDYSHDDPPVSGGGDGGDGDDDDDEGGGNGDLTVDGTVTILQKATVGNGIDVIIMGDGYTEGLISSGKYSSDMSKAIDELFEEEPYRSFRNMFNVYQVTAVSENEGYGKGATAFDGYFGSGTEVGGNHEKVAAYAEKAVPDARRINESVIIVIMNRKYYAGTCYMFTPVADGDYGLGASISYFPLGTDDEMFGQLIRHEAGGHGFAKLADEYSYQSMGTVPSSVIQDCKSQRQDWGWWKNIDFTSSQTAVRWSRFLSDSRYYYDGLGVYEGGFTYWKGVWRPTSNSIMNQNTGGYNAPSREAIYYRIHKLAYGSSWKYNYEEFVRYDKGSRAAAVSTRAYSPENVEPLHPPVVINKSLSSDPIEKH